IDQSLRARVAEHPSNLLIEHGRIGQFALYSQIEQFVVRNAAPQKERETRRQLEIGEAVRRTSDDVGRLALDPEHEARRGENSPEAVLDASVEAAFFPSRAIETHQRRCVLIGERATKRPAGDRRENLLRARLLFSGVRWMAHEDLPAALRIALEF